MSKLAGFVHVVYAEANLVARLHRRIRTDESSSRERIELIHVADSAVRVSCRFCQSSAQRMADSNHSRGRAATTANGCAVLDLCRNRLLGIESWKQPTQIQP